MSAANPGHRVVLTFDDGVYARLICPDDGSCQPANTCPECYRDVRDPDSEACDVCEGEPSDACWVKSWFDACSAEELLRGKLEIPITARWEGDHIEVDVHQPGSPHEADAP